MVNESFSYRLSHSICFKVSHCFKESRYACMPHETQGIFCDNFVPVGNTFAESKYNVFTAAELRRIFQSPINPNTATINLDLFLSQGERRIRDFLVSSVCVKYQHLQHLSMSWSHLPPNLAPLNILAHLKSWELHTFGRITLKFDTHWMSMKHRHFNQFQHFIDRHSKLSSFDIDGIWPGILDICSTM